MIQGYIQHLKDIHLRNFWNSCIVKREMLVAIIFGGFENIIIWQRFNLEILLDESGWGPYLFHLVATNFGKNLLIGQFRQINLRQ